MAEISNADVIRAMNDEQLRDFLFAFAANECCGCAYYGRWKGCLSDEEEDCEYGILKWLKSEAPDFKPEEESKNE